MAGKNDEKKKLNKTFSGALNELSFSLLCTLTNNPQFDSKTMLNDLGLNNTLFKEVSKVWEKKGEICSELTSSFVYYLYFLTAKNKRESLELL